MIVSDLKNINQQLRTNPHFEKAFAFLQRKDLASLPDGRVTVDGTNVYVEVQSYTTKPAAEAKYEAHRKYIDVQYVVSGEESIGWVAIERVNITTPYVDEHDYLLGTADPAETTLVKLTAGQFAVLWPGDAHSPRLATHAPTPVKKLVIKVAVTP